MNRYLAMGFNRGKIDYDYIESPQTAQALDALKDEYGIDRGVGAISPTSPADFGIPAPGSNNEMGLNAAYNNYADYAEDMEQASKMGELVTYELDQVYAHVHETRMGGQSMKEITGYSFHFNTKRVKYSSNSSGNWLSSPVGDAPVSSEFMSTRTCTGCSNTHGGTDYAVPVGTSVAATAPGTVARAYKSGSYGNVVIVNHGASAHGGGNIYTLYAHGNSLQVQQGANVNTGDLLIYSGNTGRSTGPHLHYEVIVTPYTPFQSQFYGNLQMRHAPNDLGYFLGY